MHYYVNYYNSQISVFVFRDDIVKSWVVVVSWIKELCLLVPVMIGDTIILWLGPVHIARLGSKSRNRRIISNMIKKSFWHLNYCVNCKYLFFPSIWNQQHELNFHVQFYLFMYQRVKEAPTAPSMNSGHRAFSRPTKASLRWVNSLLAWKLELSTFQA